MEHTFYLVRSADESHNVNGAAMDNVLATKERKSKHSRYVRRDVLMGYFVGTDRRRKGAFWNLPVVSKGALHGPEAQELAKTHGLAIPADEIRKYDPEAPNKAGENLRLWIKQNVLEPAGIGADAVSLVIVDEA